MTTTEEEIWALTEGEGFLFFLAGVDKIRSVSEIRQRASRILRHFPNLSRVYRFRGVTAHLSTK